MWRNFWQQLAPDLGIDLGTANTLVHVGGRGVVLCEPSVVALDRSSGVGNGSICCIGEEAKAMIGRTPPHLHAVRPLRDGVIADFDLTREMLRYFIGRAQRGRTFASPRIMIGVPTGITEVEKRAVVNAAALAGARDARTVEEPMAAALGADLPVGESAASMIVDIGGGTTEIAIISLGGVVTARSARVGGDEMDEAILHYLRRRYNLLIGERTAEKLKIERGSAWAVLPDEKFIVRGRDLVSGLPAGVELSSGELREAVREPVREIVELVRGALEGAPPELAADVMERGLTLAGGGALLRGLDVAISREVGTPVRVALDPISCVALGTGRALEMWRN